MDGVPLAKAGLQTHGDMLVINVAPGCEYFLHKHEGDSMRCRFCAYGAPDERTHHLGQVAGQVGIPERTLERMAQGLHAVVEPDHHPAHLSGRRFAHRLRARRASASCSWPAS